MPVSLSGLPSAPKEYVADLPKLDGGLNLWDLDYRMDANQSPDMQNLYWLDGALSCRPGQSWITAEEDLGEGFTCFQDLFWEHAFLHIGDGIYAVDVRNVESASDDAPLGMVKLLSGVPQSRGTFFRYGEDLYYKNRGGYYKISYEDGGFAVGNVEAYSPITYINMEPTTHAGDEYQPENRLCPQKTVWYSVVEGVKEYHLPVNELDSVDKVIVDDVELVEGTGYTVDLAKGTVNFATEPKYHDPYVANTVKITFTKHNPDAYNSIMDCPYAAVYGGDQNLCVVLGGCRNQPNAYFWCGNHIIMDPGYFPFEQYNFAGDTEERITGFGKQQSMLVVFKERSLGRADFSTTTMASGRVMMQMPYTRINDRIGCDLPWSIQLVENNLVFCNTENGVYLLKDSTAAYENNVVGISRNVNGAERKLGLLNDVRKADTVASFNDGDRYWVVANNAAYLWDFGLSTYSEPSWFYYTNIGAVAFFKENELCFHVNKRGRLTALRNHFMDYGEAIPNGDLIPLSKRFNKSNSDVRYSARRARTDTEEFRNWFHDDSGELTNPDGTPKVFLRGDNFSGATQFFSGNENHSGGIYFSTDMDTAGFYAHQYDDSFSMEAPEFMPQVFESWNDAFMSTQDGELGYNVAVERAPDGWELMVRRRAEKGVRWETLATFPNTAEGLEQFNAQYGQILQDAAVENPAYMQVYLSAQNTKVIDAEGRTWDDVDSAGLRTNDIARQAWKDGYDMVIVKNVQDGAPAGMEFDEFDNYKPKLKTIDVYIAKDSSQAKSVYNTGNFDADNPDVRYSVSKSQPFAEQVHRALTESAKENMLHALYIRDTPQALAQVGLGDLPMCMTAAHVKDINSPEGHDIPEGLIARLPVLLSTPAAVLDSRTRAGSIIVVTQARDRHGRPVVVSIKPNGWATVDGKRGPANFITSMYGRNDFERYIETSMEHDNFLAWNQERMDRIYGYSDNKKGAPQYAVPERQSSGRLTDGPNEAEQTMPERQSSGLSADGSTEIIRDYAGAVKGNIPERRFSAGSAYREYAPTFYSKMEQEISAFKQAKMGASSVVSYLKGHGVKDEEIKWSGIEQWLEGKKSVTKEELLEFAKLNAIELEVQELDGHREVAQLMDQTTGELYTDMEHMREVAYAMAEGQGYSRDDVLFDYSRYPHAGVVRVTVFDDGDEIDLTTVQAEFSDKDPQWERYKTPGGDNYRELLYKMPGSEYTNHAMDVHWGNAGEGSGVLAHARVQDFETEDGLMLFIDEIQSDWHNAGAEDGYRTSRKNTELIDHGWYYAIKVGADEFDNILTKARLDGLYESDHYALRGMNHDTKEAFAKDFLFNQFTATDNRAPEAPYSKNYHEYVLKRLIREAAEQGYDSIGWTTGKMQEDRWSSEYAEGYRIEYDQDMPKFLNKYGKQWGARVERGRLATDRDFYEGRIKEVEDDLAYFEDKADSTDSESEYQFYLRQAEMAREQLISLTDKAKGTEIWKMKITDQMREDVLYKGQPRYSAGKKGNTKTGGNTGNVNPETGYEAGSVADSFMRILNTGDREGALNVLEEAARMLAEAEAQRAEQRRDELVSQVFRPKLTEDVITRNKRVIEELIAKYGRMEQTSAAQQEVRFPKKIDANTKVRGFVQTAAATNAAATEDVRNTLADDIVKGRVGATYQPVSDRATLDKISEQFSTKTGFERALREWRAKVDSGTMPSKEDIALGEALFVQACAEGQTFEAQKLASEIAIMGTQLGQAVQAMSLVKRMTPAGQVYYIQKTVDRLNAEKAQQKRNVRIVIDEKLAQQLLAAKTKEEMDAAIDAIIQSLADQMPVTIYDKWNTWRYLAMLGNPRTHFRNLAGNAIFVPARLIKDVAAMGMERMVIKDKSKRTKGIADKDLRAFAMEDADLMGDELRDGGKYETKDLIRDRRRIFKLAPLNWAAQTNSRLLEAEDWVFLKSAYANALGGYLAAQGFTAEQVSGANSTPEGRAALDRARVYAVEEAKKATYRDASKLAQWMNHSARNTGPVGSIIWGGLMPFTKTPINIVKRGIEYSPVGLMTTIAKGATKLRKGEMTAAQFIDGLAAGLTGTAIVGLGYALAHMGLLVGGLGDDDEDKFEQLQGNQEYSIRVGDKSFTIDWMAPTVLPLFVGEAIHKFSENEGVDGWEVLEAAAGLLDPIMSLSMLDGLNQTLSAVKYDTGEPIPAILQTIVGSYVSQGIPTVLGSVARTIDDSRRASFTPSGQTSVQRWLSRLWQTSFLGKTPFAAEKRMAYVDEWGRTDTESSVLMRALENFVSPGYINPLKETPLESEIARLAEATGDNGVYPNKAQKYFSVGGETYAMSQDEYEEHLLFRGQKSYQLASDITTSRTYDALDDKTRTKALELAYDYAATLAKLNTNEAYAADKWILKLAEFEKRGGDAAEYLLLRAQSNVAKLEGDADADSLTEQVLSNSAVSAKDAAEVLVMEADSVKVFTDPYISGYEYKMDEAAQERYAQMYHDLYLSAYLELVQDDEFVEGTLADRKKMVSELGTEVGKQVKYDMADWYWEQGIDSTEKS